MASVLIHIIVADKVNKKLLHMPEDKLFLGTIAPDLAKEIGVDKKKSHFITYDNSSTPNIYQFHDKYKNSLDNPYDMGYFIHLLVDKKWYDEFTPHYYWDYYTNELKTNDGLKTVNESEKKRIVYNDYTVLNHYLLDHYNASLDLFYNPFKIPETDITEVDVSQIGLLVDKMGMIIRDANSKKLELFNASRIDQFIDECSDEIIYILNNIKK